MLIENKKQKPKNKRKKKVNPVISAICTVSFKNRIISVKKPKEQQKSSWTHHILCSFYTIVFCLRYCKHRLPSEVAEGREGSTSLAHCDQLCASDPSSRKRKSGWGFWNTRSHLCLLRYLMSQHHVTFNSLIMHWQAKPGMLGFSGARQVRISMLLSSLVICAVWAKPWSFRGMPCLCRPL